MMRLCSRALEKKGAARARQTESCGAGRLYKGAGREFVAIGNIYNCHWGSKKRFTSVKACVDAFEEGEFCFLNLPNALPFSFGQYHTSLGFTSSRIRREISGITHHYYPVAETKQKKRPTDKFKHHENLPAKQSTGWLSATVCSAKICSIRSRFPEFRRPAQSNSSRDCFGALLCFFLWISKGSKCFPKYL